MPDSSQPDARTRLEDLRDHFQARLIDASDRDATAIGRLIKDINDDLAKMPDGAEVSAADEVAKRRAARRAGSAGTTHASSSS